MIFFSVFARMLLFTCQNLLFQPLCCFVKFVLKMSRIEIDVKKKILHIWCTEKGISFNRIAKRVKVQPASVKRIIERFGKELSFEDSTRRGRKPGSVDPKLDQKVVDYIQQNRSASVRDLAKKFKTSIGMIQRIKKRHNLRTFKKQKTPKQSPEQKCRAKNRARKLALQPFFG